MYQPTEDLNWHWLGGDDGSGPAPPCAVSATFVQNHENNVLTEPGGGHQSQIQTQGHVNGNGTTDSCYYDAYQYPYNYVAPIEAQYVGTVIHGSGGDPTQNVIRINPGPVPVTNGGSSPSIFDLSTQVVPVSISAVEPDSASLLDLSNLTSSSSIMDLSNHIAAYLQDGEDDTGRNEAQSGTYTMATLPAGAGTTPTPGFSQADGELRILKTENRFAVDGFIPTVSTPTKSSNGYVFARKSTPSPGNGFSVNADIDDEDEDDEEEDDWEEQNDREHEQQSRHRRRMQRLHPNARVTQIQNQRNAQHPNARPCEICGNLFRGKLVLRRHQIVIHGMKLPNWEQVLAAEERNNAKVPCGVCGKEVSKRSLNIHMTQVHGGGRMAPASGRRFKKAKKIGRPRKAPPVLEPQAHAHRQMLTPMPTSSSSSSTNKIDYSYLLLPRYQPFVPVERFTNIAKAVARYEQYVAARITKKRRSSSFDSAAWKKSLPSATCNLCGNVFRHKYTLRVHQAKVHKLPVPRLYTKRTPTPSPVKISGQAHAPPPPPNVVRALFRSATATASGSNTSAPPTLERNMDPLPLGESLSPAMPCLTPAATTAALTAATRPRPRPVSRQLALSRAAGDKAHANSALIRNSRFLDYLQSPNLQPRLRQATAKPHDPRSHESRVPPQESSSSKRKRGWPRGKLRGPKRRPSDLKSKIHPRQPPLPRRHRRHQPWSRRRRRAMPHSQPGPRLVSSTAASAKTQPTVSSTSSKSSLSLDLDQVKHNLSSELVGEIRRRQVVIKIFRTKSVPEVKFLSSVADTEQRRQLPKLPVELKLLKNAKGMPLQCHVCLNVFTTHHVLHRHQALMHNLNVNRYDEFVQKNSKEVRCKKCGCILLRRKMYHHLKATHHVSFDFTHHFTAVTQTDRDQPKPEQVHPATLPEAPSSLPSNEKLSSEPELSSRKSSPKERRQDLIKKVRKHRLTKTVCRSWTCSVCHVVLSSANVLYQHQFRRHGLESPGFTPAVRAEMQRAKWRVQCKICNFTCIRSSYSLHFKLKHKQDGFSPYPLKQHFTVLQSQPEENQINPEPESNAEQDTRQDERKVCCNICGEVYSKPVMYRHLELKHGRRRAFEGMFTEAGEASSEPGPTTVTCRSSTECVTIKDAEKGESHDDNQPESEAENVNVDAGPSPSPSPTVSLITESNKATTHSEFYCDISQKELTSQESLKHHHTLGHSLPVSDTPAPVINWNLRVIRNRQCNFCDRLYSKNAIVLHLMDHGVRDSFPQHFVVLSQEKGAPCANSNSSQLAGEGDRPGRSALDSESDSAVDSPPSIMSKPLPPPPADVYPEFSAPTSPSPSCDAFASRMASCKLCREIFTRNAVLNHLKSEHGKKKSLSRYFIYVKSTPKKKPERKCHLCTKVFPYPESLRIHQIEVHKLQMEGQENILQRFGKVRCSLCGKTMYIGSIINHLKTEHGKMSEFHQFYTRTPKNAPQRPIETVAPVLDFQPDQAPEVPTVSQTSQQLQGSSRKTRSPQSEPEPSDTKATSARCLLCNKLLNKVHIYGHLRKKHGKAAEFRKYFRYISAPRTSRVKTKAVDLRCSECSKTFRNRYDLALHKVRMHNLQFPGCEKIRKMLLERKQKVRCSICGSIVVKPSINRHFRGHGFSRAAPHHFTIVEDEIRTTAGAEPTTAELDNCSSAKEPQIEPVPLSDTVKAEPDDTETIEQTVHCNICRATMGRTSIGKHLIIVHDQRQAFWRYFTVLDDSNDGGGSKDGEEEENWTENENERCASEVEAEPRSPSLESEPPRRPNTRLRLDRNKNVVTPPNSKSEPGPDHSSTAATASTLKRRMIGPRTMRSSNSQAEDSMESGTHNGSPSRTPRSSGKKEGREHWIRQLIEEAKAAKELRRACVEIATRKPIVKLARLKMKPIEQELASAEKPPASTTPADTDKFIEANGSAAPEPVPSSLKSVSDSGPPPMSNSVSITTSSNTEETEKTDDRPPTPKKKRRRLEVSVKDDGLTLVTCPICKDSIPYANLEAHINLHRVKCHICAMDVPHLEVAVHGITHVVRLDCEVCGQVFKKREQLWEHMNRHMGMTPLICRWCGARFAMNANRRTHILIKHTNYAPFACALLCGRRFTTKTARRVHQASECRNRKVCNPPELDPQPKPMKSNPKLR